MGLDEEQRPSSPSTEKGDAAQTKVDEARQAVAQEGKKLDVAANFLASIASRPDADQLLAPWSPAEERRMVRWKIDPIIMTVLLLSSMMGAVDKVCIGSAAVLGWRDDANLTGDRYSWASSVLYFGAIGTVLPTMLLMQKFPAAKYIAFNCFMWGVLMMVLLACDSYASVAIVRLILGAFEAIIFAGYGLIMVMWWTSEEQSWRTAVVFSTLSSIMNAILSVASANYFGSALAQWQLLFLLVGVVTVAVAALLWIFLPDNPTTCWWLSDREKVIAIKRLAGNRTGVENKELKWSQVREAVLDPKSYLYFLINLCLNVPNGGVITFSALVISELGFTDQETVLMGMPNGVISWISALFFGWLATKTSRRFLTAQISCLCPLVGTIVLSVVPRSNVGGSLAGLYIVFFYWAPYCVIAATAYANTAGYTKKIAVFSFAYMGYCTGNLIGPQTFLDNEAPGYSSGVAAMLSCYCIAIALMGLMWGYCAWLNRRNAKVREEEAQMEQNELLDEWHDLTDKENPRFVYVT